MPLGVGWRIHEGTARSRRYRRGLPGHGSRVGPLVGADDQFAVHAPTLYGAATVYAPALSGVAVVDATLPAIICFAEGGDTFNGVDHTLGAITGEAYGGAYMAESLPSLAGEATGTVPVIAALNAALPAITCDATGTATSLATVNATLPSITGLAYAGAVLSATLGGVTMDATGTTGSVASVQAVVPLFEIEFTATADNYGGVDADLPTLLSGPYLEVDAVLPAFEIVAEGHAVVAVSYEAYAVNLTHTDDKSPDEVTRYTNFPFDRIIRWKGNYYGVNSSGIFLLGGTTDHATPTPTAIPWAWKTGTEDFDTPQMKRVFEVFFGGRLGASSTINLYVGEGSAVPHSFTTPRGALAQNYRQQFGKGNRARYYAVGASGSSTLELDEVAPQVAKLDRRI